MNLHFFCKIIYQLPRSHKSKKTIMKKLIYLLAISVILVSCGGQPENKEDKLKVTTMPKKKSELKENRVFGKEVSQEKAADVTRLPMLLEHSNTLDVKLIGKVSQVCQSEGCWLDMDLGNGETLHVTFKDEGFVVPKDLAGKTVLMEGRLSKEIIPVDLAKKIAKDEGKSNSEINSITSPVTEYSYIASGVVIK